MARTNEARTRLLRGLQDRGPRGGLRKAIHLRDDIRTGIHEALSPDVFPIELAHALTRAERQGRLAVAAGWPLWLSVMADPIVLRPSLPLLPRAYAISALVRIGVYDCLYVALAEQEGCELVTADVKLVTQLQTPFPFITALSTFP